MSSRCRGSHFTFFFFTTNEQRASRSIYESQWIRKRNVEKLCKVGYFLTFPSQPPPRIRVKTKSVDGHKSTFLKNAFWETRTRINRKHPSIKHWMAWQIADNKTRHHVPLQAFLLLKTKNLVALSSTSTPVLAQIVACINCRSMTLSSAHSETIQYPCQLSFHIKTFSNQWDPFILF